MVGHERYLPRQAADVIGWRQAKKLAVNILSGWKPRRSMNPRRLMTAKPALSGIGTIAK